VCGTIRSSRTQCDADIVLVVSKNPHRPSNGESLCRASNSPDSTVQWLLQTWGSAWHVRRGYELHLELVGCLLPSSIIIGLASLGVNYPPTHTALLLFYEETSESLGPANAADSFFCPFFSRALLYCACRRAIHEHREANQSSCIIDWRVLAPAAISAKPGPRPSAWRYARRTSTSI